jgi:AcrR family transcriptional regulator
MRGKSDDRRLAIMDAAAKMFRQAGLERASMSAISTSADGSKGTLYGYFDSKETQFMTVMLCAADEQTQAFINGLDRLPGDLRQALTLIGNTYLSLVLAVDVAAVIRIAIADDSNSLGRVLYDRGPKQGWQLVIDFLAREIGAGLLRNADSVVAATHLKGLFQGSVCEPSLFGAMPDITREDAVREAVDVFLRTYGPIESERRTGAKS